MMVAELGEGGKTWFIVNVFSSIVEGFAGCWGREKRKDNLDTKDSHLYTDREMPTMDSSGRVKRVVPAISPYLSFEMKFTGRILS